MKIEGWSAINKLTRSHRDNRRNSTLKILRYRGHGHRQMCSKGPGTLMNASGLQWVIGIQAAPLPLGTFEEDLNSRKTASITIYNFLHLTWCLKGWCEPQEISKWSQNSSSKPLSPWDTYCCLEELFYNVCRPHQAWPRRYRNLLYIHHRSRFHSVYTWEHRLQDEKTVLSKTDIIIPSQWGQRSPYAWKSLVHFAHEYILHMRLHQQSQTVQDEIWGWCSSTSQAIRHRNNWLADNHTHLSSVHSCPHCIYGAVSLCCLWVMC